MKKISEINVDTSKAAGNGGIASSSVTSSSKQFLANGDSSDRAHNPLSNDLSFPPGGVPSLRLPVVVVLNSSIWSFTCSIKDLLKILFQFII